jgi:dolichol-phosphate mannosyltransferase
MQTRIRRLVTRMTENTNPTIPNPVTQKDTQTLLSQTILVIPTLNEEDAIGALVAEAKAVGFSNIMVIDGFSVDDTRRIASREDAKVLLQDFGKGKGCGMRTGMREFLKSDAPVLCAIDGDATNDPSYLPKMVAIVDADAADVVLGSRTLGPREAGAMNAVSLASNLTASFLLGAKFRRLFTDIQTGYWVFNRKAVQRIYPRIRSTGFEIELELFVTILKEHLRVSEIPVGFRVRKGKTKFRFMMRLRNLYYVFKFLAS